MKILVHNSNGLKYFEAQGKDFNLLSFSMTGLINELFSLYSIDYRVYLFPCFFPADFGVINHSQLN